MSLPSPVSTSVVDGIARITIDNPPVNAISQAVREGLLEAISQVNEDVSVRAAVLTCAGRTFVSGADIKEFGKPPQRPFLPEVMAAVEGARVPIVAALHGTALGGGLELALACHGRVAAAPTRLGLPEVSLGILPGAGGTVRLPRLVPVERAIDMITGGKPISADTALEIGLVDAIAEGDPTHEAEVLARALATRGKPEPLIKRRITRRPDAGFWDKTEADLRRKARGQQSPIEALSAIREGLELAPDEALAQERERFLRLQGSLEAAALRHVFFAERNTASSIRSLDAEPVDLAHVGVIGGGTMGAGIATALLLAASSVTLIERDNAATELARKRISQTLGVSAERGVIAHGEIEPMLARLTTTTDYAALGSCHLIIEAVFEDLTVKAEVFNKLEDIVQPSTVLATNTSYLDVDEIAAGTRHPERVVGLHFFSPAQVMKLLEIVRGKASGPVALATGLALAKRLKKIPVVAGVCDGFIGNRIMSAYRRDCEFMLEEGALPQDVDAAMRQFGFAMGIFEVQDLSGLDIAWAMRKRRATTRLPEERYSRISDRLCEAGRLGRKTGSGFYDYSSGKPTPAPFVEQIIQEESAVRGFNRRSFTPDEIMARILKVMRAEGEAILDEGIAESASDIDVVMITGYGFPRHKGGPMFSI
jgi:3-hydroxyacyl-CoA dehydrogenase